MKTGLLVVIILVVSLGLGVGTRYTVFRLSGDKISELRSEANNDNSDVSGVIEAIDKNNPPSPNSSLKTYTNSNYHISFEYPSAWVERDLSSMGTSAVEFNDPVTAVLKIQNPNLICGTANDYKTGEECISLQIDLKPASFLTDEASIEQGLKGGGVQYTKDQVTIGGIYSTRFIAHGNGFGIDNRRITILIPGKGIGGNMLLIQANCMTALPVTCSSNIEEVMANIVTPSFNFL